MFLALHCARVGGCITLFGPQDLSGYLGLVYCLDLGPGVAIAFPLMLDTLIEHGSKWKSNSEFLFMHCFRLSSSV